MTDEMRWKSILDYRTNPGERFLYGLRTSRQVCRPTCTASIPVREDTVFFDCYGDALERGFQPCSHCRPDLGDQEPESTLLDRVCLLFEKEDTWRAPLSEAARTLGLSAAALSRLFKEETGLTPAAYMDARKVKAAKDYLALSTIPIAEMAQRLGFPGTEAFSSFFATNAGVPPEAYRRGEGQIRFPASPVVGIYLVDTALGRLLITENRTAITGLRFVDILPDELMNRLNGRRSELMEKAIEEISAFFSGASQAFSVPVEVSGTPFQLKVWELLGSIPYGQTRTYAQIAEEAGTPGASRAVGAAANRNPLLVMIPCHRVIGSNGTLVGYAGGVDLKEKLLRLERMQLAANHG